MGKTADDLIREALSPASHPDPFDSPNAVAVWLQDVAPFGIFTTDTSLVIRTWNHWLYVHSGLTAENVIGRPLLEVFPDLVARRLDGHFSRALAGEISVLSTALHKHLLPFPSPVRGAGPHMLQTARIVPLPSGGRIVGSMSIIEDVTQRECQAAILRRQQDHDHLLSETLAVLLQSESPLDIAAELFPRFAAPLALDVYFCYLYAPESKELQLHSARGVTPEVRRSLASIPVSEGFCGLVATRRQPLVESRVHLNETTRARHARRIGIRSFVGYPLVMGDRLLGTLSFGSYLRERIAADEVEFLGKLALYVSVALDRAQREQTLRDAERRLRDHAGELETRIAERTARLQETIRQLESFSYTVAHDLRAPIRSLSGFSEILMQDHCPALPEEARDLVSRLNRASAQLDSLTRDLLKFSRLVRQEVQLEPVDLDELVNDIVSLTPTLQGGVLTVAGPLGSALGQHTLLRQCLVNLFDNALKFTSPGRHASIVIRSETRGLTSSLRSRTSGAPFNPSTSGQPPAAGLRRRIWVEDNGIGIEAGAHQRIFGIFERVPGHREIEGNGIGLAIVARATEQLGGTCGVESSVGEGSRFWIELAAAEPA